MIKRIAIVGPECTGKSTLSAELAQHFNSRWVPEFARTYLENLNRPYIQSDLLEIAKGQLSWEEEQVAHANRFLFCDTNLLVIKIWSEFKYQSTDQEILKLWQSKNYALHLLTDIDIPWEDDPQREHPEKRAQLFEIYREHLLKENISYIHIKGSKTERLQEAIRAIEKLS
ncbi:MAG TPA: ATP-binding protein [Cyclobacteriaceae bacterium]|nr:ATP-binding protein [Cyclobacteriaceae bacterium]